MAIERMKSVWLFAPQGQARPVLDQLARIGLCHVVDCEENVEGDLEKIGIERVFPDAGDVERRVQKLREILDTLTGFHRTSRQFLENFIPTPVEVLRTDVRRALREVEIDKMHADVKRREREYHAAVAAHEKAKETLKSLSVYESVSTLVPGGADQRRAAAFLGAMPARKLPALQADERLPADAAVTRLNGAGRSAIFQAACPIEARETLAALLREYGAETIEPEERTVRLDEYLAHRRSEAAEWAEKVREIRRQLSEIGKANQRSVEVALGYWEERLRTIRAAMLLAESTRLTILKGYVREADLPDFQRRLEEAMPRVAVQVRDPEPGETVPISLRNPRLFAPAQFLVNMFGLPDYFTVDPTPVIFFSFLTFFGICFGDVLYGILLIVCGLLLARKYAEYTNLRNFFSLLALAGLPTVVVGALTGAWAADLPRYLGEGNPLLGLSKGLMLADPVDKALAFLVLCLFLGMLNQFIGIIMLMVRNVRQGNVKAAIFDGAFWLLALPGFAVLAAGIFVPLSETLSRAGWTLLGLGALGLALTQGRSEKSFVGKVVVGIVSLYGIVGTYGITAFIGDTLSYSRLLALGLTTGIVGLCFNMIANMTRDIPVVGVVCFILIVLAGHLLNFVLSVLGGFVHSARLTFVEFFGRFYQGGSPRFTPLGSWQGRIRVMDTDTVWTES